MSASSNEHDRALENRGAKRRRWSSTTLVAVGATLALGACGGSDPPLLEDLSGGAPVGDSNSGGPSPRGWAVALGERTLKVRDEGFVVRGWEAPDTMEGVPLSVAISTPSNAGCDYVSYVPFGPRPVAESLGWCPYRSLRGVRLRPHQRLYLAIVLRPRCSERRTRVTFREVRLDVRTDDGEDRTVVLPTRGRIRLDLRKPCFSTPSRQLTGTRWPGRAAVPPSAWPW